MSIIKSQVNCYQNVNHKGGKRNLERVTERREKVIEKLEIEKLIK